MPFLVEISEEIVSSLQAFNSVGQIRNGLLRESVMRIKQVLKNFDFLLQKFGNNTKEIIKFLRLRVPWVYHWFLLPSSRLKFFCLLSEP